VRARADRRADGQARRAGQAGGQAGRRAGQAGGQAGRRAGWQGAGWARRAGAGTGSAAGPIVYQSVSVSKYNSL
jgi:hypothetical protein